MAKTSDQSRILSKMKQKAKGAFKTAAGKETRVKGSGLPGGIINGIAQLSSWKLGETDDKKIPFLTLTGVTLEPQEFKGVRCSVTVRFEESNNKTLQDKYDDALNNIRLIGGDDCVEGKDIDDIPDICDQLVSEKPCYKFNTREWEFNGRKGVSIFIQGPTTYETSDDEEVVVEPEAQEDQQSEAVPEVTPDATQVDTPAEEEYVPQKGDVYGYTANPKVGRKDYEVVDVNVEKNTVDLKEVGGIKILKSVPFSKLEA